MKKACLLRFDYLALFWLEVCEIYICQEGSTYRWQLVRKSSGVASWVFILYWISQLFVAILFFASHCWWLWPFRMKTARESHPGKFSCLWHFLSVFQIHNVEQISYFNSVFLDIQASNSSMQSFPLSVHMQPVTGLAILKPISPSDSLHFTFWSKGCNLCIVDRLSLL